MAFQPGLFPIRSQIEVPKRKHSADALGEVEGDDGHWYFVKGDDNQRPTRASEWVSTHLAEAIGIGAPAPAVIQLRSGALVFGSRKISGTADDAITAAYLLSPSQANVAVQPAVGLRRILSSIYAFDMFLFNDDRHPGNYLSHDDAGTRRLYAFDFSRCLFWAWPWSGFPRPNQNTRGWGSVLRNNHGFDLDAASDIVRRLETYPCEMVEGFINRMPPEWLPSGLREQFLSWWAGSARAERARELVTGLSDGTLL